MLKRIQKTKGFENKYKDKAAVLLDKLLHFNEYSMLQNADGTVRGHLQRSVTQKPKDYTATVKISGRKRSRKENDGDDLDEAELERELDGIREEEDSTMQQKLGNSLDNHEDEAQLT